MSGTAAPRSARWWPRTAEGARSDVHTILGPVVRKLRDQQASRREAYLHFIRSYAGAAVSGLTMGSYSRVENVGLAAAAGLRPKPLAFNVVTSCCNTAQAKIAKNRPVPQFLTSGGDWGMQRRAKGLSKYVEGAFVRCKVWETDPLVVLDALVPGDGVVKVYRDGDETKVEREFPWRVLTDDVEGQYGLGSLRSKYHCKPYDRGVLCEMFPEHREDIENAQPDSDEEDWGADSTADQILVTEAWHLRSGKNAKDGRRAIMIHGVTLLDEPYERDYFPFVWLQRNPPLMGTRAVGMAEEIDGIQQEINFTARTVQLSFKKNGGSYWSVRKGTRVSEAAFNNGQATRLEWDGPVEPKLIQQTPIHPASLDYLFALIPKAFELSGVSQLSASSVKPPGLNSGAAQREYNDLETERFVVFAKAFETFHLEIARQLIELEREIAEENPDHAVKAPGKRFIKSIKFKDVDLKEDAYVMQCFPTSMLSKTPAGRLAMVGDLAKAGWITPAQAKRLLDMPDLERLNDLEGAAHELVEELIERMLDEGLYESPEPYMDLVDAAHTTQQAYLRAKIDGAPEPNLQLLRDFIDDCLALLREQAGPEPVNNNGGPPAPGMPPPAPIEATGQYGPGAAPPPLPMVANG